MMNEIINQTVQTPIEVALGIDENGMTTARKLYAFLELSKGQFSRWAKVNIEENEFATENEDYWGFDINVEGNITKDFKLTAHFAKKLSMKGNGERAERAREYFTRIEERVKQISIDRKALSPQMQALMSLTEGMARQELEQKRQAEQLNRIEQKQNAIVETFTDMPDAETFNAWVNRCIGKIAESPNYKNGNTRNIRYQNARTESYDRLNQKKPCRLMQRVAYAKEVAMQNGATKTKANEINRLTIIANDKSLKPIYETVIKEMMITYCVEVA